MKNLFKQLGVAAAVFAPALVAAQGAPKSGVDVIARMHDAYVGKWYSTLHFTQRTDMRAANDSVTTQIWFETAKLPGRLRINRLTDDNQNVILYRVDSTYVRRNGAAFTARKGRNELLTLGFDIYADDVKHSADILTEAGYDLAAKSAAARGRTGWCGYRKVAAAFGDSSTRQFWIDKERLVYVRSLEPNARDPKSMTEIVFGDYAPLAACGWIARDVSVTAGRQGRAARTLLRHHREHARGGRRI